MTASMERRPGRLDGDRRTGAAGLLFVLLLLIGAGMASVPGAEATTTAVRNFYEQHTGVVVLAQVVELLAVLPLVVFVLGLARRRLVGGGRQLAAAGLSMAAAAVITAIPPLWLCGAASNGSDALVDTLALFSDLVDVLLFLTIAWFAASCARAFPAPTWLPWAALALAALGALRAVEILFRGSTLAVAGPVALLLFVVAVSVSLLRPSEGHAQRLQALP